MALSVIGVGFGRTGTLSLKVTLELLGFGRCYHMVEVREHPEHISCWNDAANGNPVDWEALFTGYKAAVDWPVCYFWRALIDYYPDAKILLTIRDPERWYQSMYHTIYQVLMQPLPHTHALRRAQRAMAGKIILERTFAGCFADQEHAIAVYERHNAAVQHVVPPERLLVYHVAEGWEPLCRFLARPVPNQPFPRVNTTAEFQQRFGSNEG